MAQTEGVKCEKAPKSQVHGGFRVEARSPEAAVRSQTSVVITTWQPVPGGTRCTAGTALCE